VSENHSETKLERKVPEIAIVVGNEVPENLEAHYSGRLMRAMLDWRLLLCMHLILMNKFPFAFKLFLSHQWEH
jgi:hypothetical protein